MGSSAIAFTNCTVQFTQVLHKFYFIFFYFFTFIFLLFSFFILIGLDLRSIWILLITENWKYYSKIIFKYISSAIRLNFKIKFAKICIYRFFKQYTELTKNVPKKLSYKCNSNVGLKLQIYPLHQSQSNN